MTLEARRATADRFVKWLESKTSSELVEINELIPTSRSTELKSAHRRLLTTKPPAAQRQAVNKALRDLWAESEIREALGSDSEFMGFSSTIDLGAHAILVRHRLERETFDLIVQPFRDAGFDFDQGA